MQAVKARHAGVKPHCYVIAPRRIWSKREANQQSDSYVSKRQLRQRPTQGSGLASQLLGDILEKPTDAPALAAIVGNEPAVRFCRTFAQRTCLCLTSRGSRS